MQGEAVTMGELEAVARGLTVLREKGATLKAVATALLDDNPSTGAEKALKPPKRVELTDTVVHALKKLPEVFGQVQPTEVRMLTDEESTALWEERKAINDILTALTTRKDAITDAVHNHMDLRAQAEGLVKRTTERDANGHVLLASKGNPERLAIQGTNEEWSREYVSGSVTIAAEQLPEMVEQGELPREVYLSMTRAVRVFDEGRAFNAMAKDPTLLGVLKKITKRGPARLSLYVRKQKK